MDQLDRPIVKLGEGVTKFDGHDSNGGRRVILGYVTGVKIAHSGTNRVSVPHPKTEYMYLIRFDQINTEKWYPTRRLKAMLAERDRFGRKKSHEDPSCAAQFTRTPSPGPTTPEIEITRLANFNRAQCVQTTGHDFLSRSLNYDSEDSVEESTEEGEMVDNWEI